MRKTDMDELLERFNERLDKNNEVIIEDWDYLPSDILYKVDQKRYENHFEYYLEELIDRNELRVIDNEYYFID